MDSNTPITKGLLMIRNKKVVCVLPSYNSEKTLERTIRAVPSGIVDLFILVDDCSKDRSVEKARSLLLNFLFL